MRVPFFFIIIICFLFGCASKRERAEKFLNENPVVFPQLCAINFPVKEEFIEGKPIVDTLIIEIPGIEIPCPEYVDEKGQKQRPTVKCPDTQKMDIYERKTDTIYKENTANVIRLQTQNSLLTEKNKALLSDVNDLNSIVRKWKFIAAGVALLFICSIYLIIRK